MTGPIRCPNSAIAEPFAGTAEAPEAAPSPNPVATSIARAVLHILISCLKVLGIGANSEHHGGPCSQCPTRNEPRQEPEFFHAAEQKRRLVRSSPRKNCLRAATQSESADRGRC